MTDWGVHLIDPVHQCFDEVMPIAVSAMGSKFYVKDNIETPDTMLATYHYPKFLASYESRTCNPMPLFGNRGRDCSIHGTEATLIVKRSGCWLTPNGRTSKVQPRRTRRTGNGLMNVPHWQNLLACIKSREKPTSEIETCVRSTTACMLANLSMRFKTRLDWDEKNWTVLQKEARGISTHGTASPGSWKSKSAARFRPAA